jgi:hypothetical protein
VEQITLIRSLGIKIEELFVRAVDVTVEIIDK